MTADAYPLRWPEGWPRTMMGCHKSCYSFQNLTPEKAVSSLLHELKLLGASHVVINCNAMVRGDGRPRSDDLKLRISQPGVALYFQYNGRSMTMAQDAYDAPYANIRSLALAISAMRAIERHGGGHMMQRSFDGFAQLPPPEGSSAPAQRPWRVVLGMEGVDRSLIAEFQRPIVEDRYRRLAKEMHPDMPGGSHEAFAELNGAVEKAREELK
jgi:hypothetical protein